MAENALHNLASMFPDYGNHSHSTNTALQVDSLSAQTHFSATTCIYKVLKNVWTPTGCILRNLVGLLWTALLSCVLLVPQASPNFLSQTQQSTQQ